MKTLTIITLFFTAILFTACEGEPGLDGLDGKDGELGSIFEIEGDFTNQNDYRLFYEFPASFEIYDGDVVLVYILWEQETLDNGQVLDIWRALPQSVIFNEGILQYNYDYTLVDVQIFLDGTINFNVLSTGDIHNQIFRIAVLPAAFANTKSLDLDDLNSMMNSAKIDKDSITRIKIKSTTTK